MPHRHVEGHPRMSESAFVPSTAGDAPAVRSSSTAAAPRRAGLAQLILLLAGSCMSVLAAVLIPPVLPQLTQRFAGTPGVAVLVPIMLTVPALIIGLAAPFAGFIVDKVDRKRLLIGAMVARPNASTPATSNKRSSPRWRNGWTKTSIGRLLRYSWEAVDAISPRSWSTNVDDARLDHPLHSSVGPRHLLGFSPATWTKN